MLAAAIAEPHNTENWSLSFSCKFFRQISLFIWLMIWQLVLREGTVWSEHRGRAELLNLAKAHIQTGLNCEGNGCLTDPFCHHSFVCFYCKPHSSGWVPEDSTCFITVPKFSWAGVHPGSVEACISSWESTGVKGTWEGWNSCWKLFAGWFLGDSMTHCIFPCSLCLSTIYQLTHLIKTDKKSLRKIIESCTIELEH